MFQTQKMDKPLPPEPPTHDLSKPGLFTYIYPTFNDPNGSKHSIHGLSWTMWACIMYEIFTMQWMVDPIFVHDLPSLELSLRKLCHQPTGSRESRSPWEIRWVFCEPTWYTLAEVASYRISCCCGYPPIIKHGNGTYTICRWCSFFSTPISFGDFALPRWISGGSLYNMFHPGMKILGHTSRTCSGRTKLFGTTQVWEVKPWSLTIGIIIETMSTMFLLISVAIIQFWVVESSPFQSCQSWQWFPWDDHRPSG